jgi:hypothetical protein
MEPAGIRCEQVNFHLKPTYSTYTTASTDSTLIQPIVRGNTSETIAFQIHIFQAGSGSEPAKAAGC